MFPNLCPRILERVPRGIDISLDLVSRGIDISRSTPVKKPIGVISIHISVFLPTL